ncbi:beta-galactosidase [Streptomyces mayteni]
MLAAHCRAPAPPLAGHLAMGSPAGTPRPVTVDSRSLRRDGRPWLPVMGEFHFSRYPAADWREELLKIRAGGVDTVATYLFWNQHEEERGVLRFDGGLDVRRFVRLCHDLDLAVAARIGPWAHGESRLGGFPDWLAAEDCAPRTDDPRYLALVRRYFTAIAHELRDLSWFDGGPVVAVQVENELYDQPDHLATLRRLAEDAGLRAPLWTATAWGGALLPPDLLLPLYGGYPEAFWEDATQGPATHIRRHYFFSPIRDDHAIGADLRPTGPPDQPAAAASATPDDRRHPYATCELGGGMAIAYHRRPAIAPADITALALTKLGSGSVWQGYYLYHGASQHPGRHHPGQESHDTGYPNDLPRVSYDFQAPLGEYGQARPTYHALRAQHLLLRAWGDQLAAMPSRLPETTPAGLDDRDTPRWAVRSDGERAFLFVNNHQPHEPLPDRPGVRFAVTLAHGETVTLPTEPVTIPSGAHFVWPVRLDLGNAARLDWASAQPLTRLVHDDAPLTVLAATAGVTPRLAFPAGTQVRGPADAVRVTADAAGTLATVTAPGTGALLTVRAATGPGHARLLVLAADQAARLHHLRIAGADRLLLCPEPALVDGDLLRVHAPAGDTALALFPAPRELTGPGLQPAGADGVFTRWTLTTPTVGAPTVAALTTTARPAPPRTGGAHGRASAPADADFAHAAHYHLTLPPDAFAGEGERLLRLAYTGDAARAYVAGRLIADHFWFGPDWEIGLRRHAAEAAEHGVEIRVLPLAAETAVHVAPDAEPGLAAARHTARLDAAALHPLHPVTLRPSP